MARRMGWMSVSCPLVASRRRDLICFSKLLRPYSAKELIAFARRTGLSGYDKFLGPVQIGA